MSDLQPIKLGYTNYAKYIDKETRQQIEALIAGRTYCDTCKRKFSEANPEVMSSMCLGCFIMKRTELEFTGAVWPDNQGVPQYLFTDGRGHITMASPDSLTVQESIEATLRGGSPCPITPW